MRIPKQARLHAPKGDYMPLQKGLDTETPQWQTAPGSARSSLNMEISINGGFRTHAGYERFDGQAKPSDAPYILLPTNITGEFSLGDTVTQLVSGATGLVIVVNSDEIVMTKITGAFNETDDLQVAAVTEGTANGEPSGASTAILDAQYANLAADQFRSDIAAVPGSGSILGVWMNSGVSDTKYAFRNNAGGTACEIYKSSSSGWVLIDLGEELSFTSGGTYVIAEGDTITGAISTVTATVERIVIDSGSFAGGDAAGRLILSGQSGAFQAEDLDVGANLNVATIAANSTEITLLPGGRFEFVNANFGGQLSSKRIYGCDGVNTGFEFDGAVLTPIITGLTVDAPSHVTFHKNHLFFSFESSVQHSGIGAPYSWSPVFGAAELATGDTVTGFMSEPGGETGATLGIYNRNTSHMLYGNSSADWVLVRYRDEVGAVEHTIQQIGVTTFLDDRGVTTLGTVEAHGNFQHATITSDLQQAINEKRGLAIASSIVRERNQYRIYFSDNTALYVTMIDGKSIGVMPQALNHRVNCMFSLENTTGAEEIFFGSDSGLVYQMEKGTSFDGDAILAFAFMHNHYLKSLRTKKKFLTATIQAKGDGYSETSFSYELDFSSAEIPFPDDVAIPFNFKAPTWDFGIWDEEAWDGDVRTPPQTHKLTGSSESIAYVIRSESDYFSPLTISGIYTQYIQRRQLR